MTTELRVVLIEDASADAELIRVQLVRDGFDPRLTQVDSELAYRAALDSEPQIILADYTLPQFGALRALDLLEELGRDIPVVVVSGTMGDEAASECIRRGASDYVLKDRLGRLGDAIHRALEEHRLRMEHQQAQTKLAELAAIVESSHEAIVGTTLSGTITSWNRAAERIYGYTAEEAIGRSVSMIIPPERSGELRMTAACIMREQPISQYETQRLRKDGRRIDVALAISIVRDRAGAVIGAAGMARDRTERNRALAALHDAERLYREIVDNSMEGIFQTTPEGKLLTVNPALARMHGYDNPETMVAQVTDMGAQLYADPTRRKQFKRLVRERGGVHGFEVETIRKDGAPLWLSLSARSVKDEAGQVRYFEGTAVDITERKQAEAALRASEERYRLAARATNDVIWEWNTVTNEMIWSEGLRATFGYPADLIDRPMRDGLSWWSERVHPTDRDRVLASVHEAVARGEAWSSEYRFQRGDGTYAVVLDRGYIVRSAEGDMIRAIGAMQDITERYEAENSLRNANERLELALAELRMTQYRVVEQERLRAMGTMASGIAHDFNNALSMMLGYSELALEYPETIEDRDKTRFYFEAIHTSARDAAGVVARLREFYRPREDFDDLRPVDLRAVVERAVELTRPRWHDQALARGATVRLYSDLGDTPPVLGNETELREVLTNLIFNAEAAIESSGQILVRTRFESSQVVLEVSDTGQGMTEEVRARCLEPFFTTKGEQGTGLGLSSVHGIVQRLGGSLEIESTPGHGTTIRLRLAPTGPSCSHQVGGIVQSQPSRHVLLVDDQPAVRFVVQEYLLGDGHTVETADDGDSALRVFEAGQFDLVITDRAMPRMNGDELARRIKEHSPETPVVMLTGFGGLMQEAGEMPTGVDHVLPKPPRLAAVRQLIANITPPRGHASMAESKRS